MFRHTKKYRKNKKNITKKKVNKKNKKKVFKKRYTRKYKVKKNVRSTRKNLRGGAHCDFICLLEFSINKYNEIHGITFNNTYVKKDGTYFTHVNTVPAEQHPHIHWAENEWMAFPQGRLNQLRCKSNPAVNVVQDVLDRWVAAAVEKGINSNEWVGLINIMKENAYDYECVSRKETKEITKQQEKAKQEADDAAEKQRIAKGRKVSEKLNTMVENIPLIIFNKKANIDSTTPEEVRKKLCASTINNLSNTRKRGEGAAFTQLDEDVLEIMDQQIDYINEIINHEYGNTPELNNFYKSNLLSEWCKKKEKFDWDIDTAKILIDGLYGNIKKNVYSKGGEDKLNSELKKLIPVTSQDERLSSYFPEPDESNEKESATSPSLSGKPSATPLSTSLLDTESSISNPQSSSRKSGKKKKK
jgi:hypothetical protein